MAHAGGYPAKKNSEFVLVFPIYDADRDLVNGAADLDSEISKDGGGFVDCDNEAAEIGASGIYALTITATEMAADIIAVITKTSTVGAKTTATVIYTSANNLDLISTNVYAVLADTGEMQGKLPTNKIMGSSDVDNHDTDIDTILARVTAAVATEAKQDIIDGIADDIKGYLNSANTELASVPTTVSNTIQMIQFIFEYLRNKLETTNTKETLYKEDASTAFAERTLADDGSTFTKGEMADTT